MMALWYTINGISGAPRPEMVSFVARYFEEKGKKVTLSADPLGTSYGKLANEIIVTHRVAVSAFTEALLYLTCSKEVFDAIDWDHCQVVVTRGSFLETFGYRDQLSDWALEEARKAFLLFMHHIRDTLPILSIVLTENYETAAQRAGEHFEYKNKKEKYLEDSNRFLRIKEHPIVQEIGIKVVNVEVKGRAPWEVFQKEIRPYLNMGSYDSIM